jgi:hypothetical protein
MNGRYHQEEMRPDTQLSGRHSLYVGLGTILAIAIALTVVFIYY